MQLLWPEAWRFALQLNVKIVPKPLGQRADLLAMGRSPLSSGKYPWGSFPASFVAPVSSEITQQSRQPLQHNCHETCDYAPQKQSGRFTWWEWGAPTNPQLDLWDRAPGRRIGKGRREGEGGRRGVGEEGWRYRKGRRQWRSKDGVGPCAKIPKGPHHCPITGFVCSANKQSPYSDNFWVGLIGLMFVIQAKVTDFR